MFYHRNFHWPKAEFSIVYCIWENYENPNYNVARYYCKISMDSSSPNQ